MILLIDTCGEGAGVALCRDEVVLGVMELQERAASAGIVAAVREVLANAGVELRELKGVGVVNGPGSFTGVRAGVAAAKGLCEAAELKLAAVSRLEVLSEAAGVRDRFSALYAGRGELYVRDAATGGEFLCGFEALREMAAGERIAVSESRVEELLAGAEVVVHRLSVADSLMLVRRKLDGGDCDSALVDGNYVRSESEIYGKAKVGAAS